MTINSQQAWGAQSGYAPQSFAPQGINIADLVKQIVPIVLSTLSAGPQTLQAAQPNSMSPFSNAPGSFAPQGFDLGGLIKQVVPIVLSVLSAGPQTGQGLQPQFSVGGGFTINPFSSTPGAVAPQGFDLGGLVKAIVPVVLSVLSTNPQTAQAVQPQFSVGAQLAINPFSSSPGSVAPQGFDLGGLVKAVVPIVLSVLSASPQSVQGLQVQSSGGQLAPQGLDIGNLIGTVLPIVLSVLSTSPQTGANAAMYH